MSWSPEPTRLGVIWERLVKGRNHPTSPSSLGDGNNFQKLDEWMAVLGSSLDSWSPVLGKKGRQWRWAWAWDGPALTMAMPEWPWHSTTFSQPSWADLAFLKCFPSRINAPRLSTCSTLTSWDVGMEMGNHSPLYVRQDAEVTGVTSVAFVFLIYEE